MKKILIIMTLITSAWSAIPTSPAETFNLAISLWRTPTDANEEAVYAEVVKWWGHGIYQATNGGAILGRVNFNLNGNTATNTSVLWSERRSAMSHIKGYTAGGYILFADEIVLNDGGTTDPTDDVTINLFTGTQAERLIKAKKAGYILAHEMLHYVYGLVDQYQGTDPNVSAEVTPWLPTLADRSSLNNILAHFEDHIDNSGNVDEEWMNVDMYEDFAAPYRFIDQNAQGRMYKKNGREASSWEILSRDPNVETTSWGGRGTIGSYEWNSLSNYAPEIGHTINGISYRYDAQLAPADEPDVNFVNDDIAVEIIIDVSGSMGDLPENAIIAAKGAAQDLIEQFEVGKIWSGLTTFADIANDLQPMHHIASPTIKDNFKALIGGLSASGETALYQGVEIGLTKLSHANYKNKSRVAFVLADGEHNVNPAPPNEAPVLSDLIASYKTNGIPIFTFGYTSSSTVGVGDLLSMANQTHGKFFDNLTDEADLLVAYERSMQIVTGKEQMAAGWAIDPVNADFKVASRWDIFDLRLNNTCTGYTATFLKNGVPQTPIAVPNKPDWYSFDVSTDGLTSWDVEVQGCPGVTFDLWGSSGDRNGLGRANVFVEPIHQYPLAAYISANAFDNAPITGLNAVAVINNGINDISVELNDQGMNGDKVAHDGIYGVLWDGYTTDGVYTVTVTFDNDNQNGRTSYAGMTSASSVNQESIPYTEPYNRILITSFEVEGMAFGEDHSDIMLGGTLVNDNNELIDGRMDNPTDVDYFKILNSGLVTDFMIRISNIPENFKPEVKIYDATGTTVLRTFDSKTNCTENGYILFEMTSSELAANNEFYLEIKDEQQNNTIESYTVSVGKRKITDGTTSNCPLRGDIEGVFSLVNVNSDKCVDVKGASTQYGANVQQYRCNGTGAQKWEFIKVDDTYEIKNVNSGLLLDVAWGGSNENVQQWGDVNSSNQRWKIGRLAGDLITLSPQSDFSECLDVKARSTASGANIQSYDCNTTTAQQFKLVDLNAQEFSGNYKIININSGKCVDIQGAAQYDGANVQQYQCNGSGAQSWDFTHLGGFVYEIRNIHAGKFLDVAYGGNSDNVQVWWSYPTGSSQQWEIESNGYGSFTFKPLSDNTECLTVQGSATWSSANMQSVSCSSNNWSQLFDIQK